MDYSKPWGGTNPPISRSTSRLNAVAHLSRPLAAIGLISDRKSGVRQPGWPDRRGQIERRR